MHLKTIQVTNFRLLADIEIELETLTTLVVGRNNSGKTSLYEILKRFLEEKNRGFRFEDFSTACYAKFGLSPKFLPVFSRDLGHFDAHCCA